MTVLEEFTACLWDTAGTQRGPFEATRESVRAAHPHAGLVETCQRIEAFSLHSCDCGAPVRRSGVAAVEHLAAVAAGLESAVLGEYQVLGQVRAGIAGLRQRASWLDVAVAAARELRAEAEFSASTGYLFDAALRLAGHHDRGPLLVIGAGAVARDVARRAAALGFADIAVASRREPSPPMGESRWLPFEHLPEAGRFDVAVGCLGSSAGELQPADLPQAVLHVDLGSPPNFSPAVAPSISLATIVATVRADSAESGRRERLRARLREILAERLAGRSEDANSPIGRIRKEVEAVRASEAVRISRLHPDLSAETIETITRSFVNRLFHVPSERLRRLDDQELAHRLADLFSSAEAQA